jgi:hypothetical protein
MSLATDQAAEMQNNTLCLIPLSENGDIGMLKSRELLLVALPLTLKFLGNLLLKNKSFQSIITLLLGSREASRKTSRVILLLINETGETSVLPLVGLDFDLEILSLFGELLSESLEFEELMKS